MNSYAPAGFLKVVVVLLLMTGAWLLGRRQGAITAAPVVAERTLSAALRNSEQLITELSSELAAVKTELNDTKRRSTSNESTVLSLQLALDDALQRSYQDSSELGLYRKIANAEAPEGLGIENVRFKNEPADHILLTVVQWRGRNRVEGDVRIAVEWTMPAECEFEDIPEGQKLMDSLPSARFDFRFFQELSFDWPYGEKNPEFMRLCESTRPWAIEIELIPDTKSLNSIKFKELWSDIEE